MTDTPRPAARASKSFEPPDKCPSCGAVLTDVPVVGVKCPHCGYDLEKAPPTFGQDAQARRHEQERSQGGPVR